MNWNKVFKNEYNITEFIDYLTDFNIKLREASRIADSLAEYSNIFRSYEREIAGMIHELEGIEKEFEEYRKEHNYPSPREIHIKRRNNLLYGKSRW